jgi:DNA-binding SARP family transcriptional activator
VYFKVLGPLEIDLDGRSANVNGIKQRTVLAALLAAANDVVSVDRLIDWLWPGRFPPSAPAIVQAHVSRLRRVLEPDRKPWAPSRLLLSRYPGYLLQVEPDQVDSLRFKRLLAEGRAALENGDPATAATVLARALELWRGRALADVALIEPAQEVIARLESLRLSATVMRIEADLALGRHLALVPELESLVRAHPLDERLSAQLMIALYQCGRQAQALVVYDRLRAVLAEELSIEPSPASQRLQGAILSQHPDLDAHPPWSAAGRLFTTKLISPAME